MLFHTPIFFLFFALFFLCYLLLRSRLKAQNTLILVGSYIFYGAWDYRFLVLIIVSSVTDYLAAIGCAEGRLTRHQYVKALTWLIVLSTLTLSVELKENFYFLLGVISYGIFLCAFCVFTSQRKISSEKLFIILSIVVNLGLLGVFKYFNFFVESLVDSASLVGVELSYATLNIVLPVGISFYTFQTMSYTLDVYRKKLKPSYSLVDLSAYVAFFPQLVAGPIERGAHLLPQFLERRTVTFALVRSGFYLFLWGMFKKAVVADNLAVIADPIFTNPESASSGELLVALIAFTFQIYCDFSGYSDMARGIARTMGFKLMINFNIPYASLTPSEFWRRWHISLSSWLRDYLYIPLGGNKNGNFATYRNLFLTMLLGGLWHGASWTFVLWGVAHGLILIAYRLAKTDEWLEHRDASGFIYYSQNLLMWFGFFVFIMFTWLLFRAENFGIVYDFLVGVCSFATITNGSWFTIAVIILPVIIHDIWQYFFEKAGADYLSRYPKFVRLNFILAVIFSYIFLKPGTEVAFLYFDF